MENYKELKDGVYIMKSTKPNKKYLAIVRNDVWNKYNPKSKLPMTVYKNGVIPSKKIHFGDARYQHYKDTTPLKLYSHLDHLDKDRRDNYYRRHKKKYPRYTADWFSKEYLW